MHCSEAWRLMAEGASDLGTDLPFAAVQKCDCFPAVEKCSPQGYQILVDDQQEAWSETKLGSHRASSPHWMRST
jgi:hypothetical protein